MMSTKPEVEDPWGDWFKEPVLTTATDNCDDWFKPVADERQSLTTRQKAEFIWDGAILGLLVSFWLGIGR